MAKITTIQEWRAARAPVEVELPSGNVVLLRRVSVLELASSGGIPSTLLVKAAAIKQGTTDFSDLLSDPESMKEMMAMLDPIVIASFVEPKVGLKATKNRLGINEIDQFDRLAVFQWCNQGAQKMRSFRVEPNDSVESA